MTVSFDTHAHISDKRFDEDRYTLTERLPEEGVALVCDVACDLRDVSVTLDLVDRFSFVYGAVGMHPHTASFMDNAMMDRLKAWLELPKIRALGEIGLDYYYDLSPREVQREWFDKQLSLAAELKKRGMRSKMLLQVHDELIFNVPLAEKDELVALVKDKMEHVMELSVPLTVDVKAGADWYDMEKIG